MPHKAHARAGTEGDDTEATPAGTARAVPVPAARRDTAIGIDRLDDSDMAKPTSSLNAGLQDDDRRHSRL